MIKIGDVVAYVDENGKHRYGIVQFVHSEKYINILTVCADEAKVDPYGRQAEHVTSLSLKEEYNSAGRHFIPVSITYPL